jgi:hypothetical protein
MAMLKTQLTNYPKEFNVCVKERILREIKVLIA